MNRQQITTFNAVSLLIMLLLLALDYFSFLIFLRTYLFFVPSFIIFIVSGLNIAFFLEKITRRHFDFWVMLTLAILSSIFIPPFLLITIYQLLNYADIHLVISVHLLFMLLPSFWYAIKPILSWRFNLPPDKILSFPRLSLKKIISHPATLAVTAAALVHWFNITRFFFLPVPDSYSWLLEFQSLLPINEIPLTSDLSRRAFSAIIASFYYLGHTQLYVFFKHFFPFLFVIVVPPLWLAARELKSRSRQLLFLLAGLFISPTIILETEYIRQQVVFLFFLYFAVGLTAYSVTHRDKTVFYFLGLFALFGASVHPAFLILVLTWLLSFLLSEFKFIYHHRFKFLLLAILAFPLARKFAVVNMYIRIKEQANASLGNLIAGHWNLRFPSYYVNSDTYEMSWPGLVGVSKYYAYYAGSVPLVILTLFVLFFISSISFRHFLKRYISLPATLFLTLSTLLFLLIAEIAPRFGNIAFLPDRAWQYIGILLTFPLFLLLLFLPVSSTRRKLLSLVPTILFAAIIISVGGAIYVNDLSSYIVADYEVVAINWMRQHIPNPNYIFSNTSKNLIRYHADKNYIGIYPDVYQHQDASAVLDDLLQQVNIESEVSSNLTDVSISFSLIKEQSSEGKEVLERMLRHRTVTQESYDAIERYLARVEEVVAAARADLALARDYHRYTGLVTDNLPPIYIYYATTDHRNPYSDRPYASSFTADLDFATFPALDNNPALFERVYNDNGRVIIWHVKSFSEN